MQTPLKQLKKTLHDQSPKLKQKLTALRNVASQINDLLDSTQALMEQIKQDYPNGDVPNDVDAINSELDVLKA